MEQGKPFTATTGPLVDFDAVCQHVRTAMEPTRLHAVSLHDESGDVLWLTESSMGPDEHNAVRQALEAFSNADGPAALDYDLGDARSAVLFRAVNSRRSLVGAVMVLVDTRYVRQSDKGPAQLLNPKLQRALSEFAGMRPGAASAPAAAPSPAPAAKRPSRVSVPPPFELTLADSMRIPRPVMQPPHAEASPAKAPMKVVNAAPTVAMPATNESGMPDRREQPRTSPERRQQPRISPEIDRLNAALRRSPIALYVQRLVPLSKGTPLRRYEVLLRSKADNAPNTAPHAMLKAAVEHGLGSMIDRRVLTELIGWLVHHPEVWQKRAVLFSVNLTKTALLDEHFIKFVELCLMKSSLPQAMIAFEIDVPTAMQVPENMAEVAAALHRLGCPVVLDDFALRTECFDLLRLPAVRYVKLAANMTAKMRTDKLSQAGITAVVQMARVLGMHTVAKRTETAAEQEWLTALGVDFIQSNALSPPRPIDGLSKSKKPTI